jgi:hypothetical protein
VFELRSNCSTAWLALAPMVDVSTTVIGASNGTSNTTGYRAI